MEPLVNKVIVTLSGGNGEGISLALRFRWYYFVMLVAATVFITAGGYVINDYFDTKTDLINKGHVIVGIRISRRGVILLHNLLNAFGVLLGFYISWKAGYLWMGLFFLLVSGLLYFYSASYKRQFLIGNLIVSILTAMVPMLVVIFEIQALYRYCAMNISNPPNLGFLLYWGAGFAIFAFLTTLIREIIKDMEDVEGDLEYGRNTVPLVLGMNTAGYIVAGLVILTISLLYLTWYFFLNDKITLLYISLAIVVPLVYVVVQVVTGRERVHFHRADIMVKITMLSGILYSVIVKIILTWNLV